MHIEEYDILQEIHKKLVGQENTVITCDKELEPLQEKLLFCKGVYQAKRMWKLQEQIMDKTQ